MRPYYADEHVTLYLGDCREVPEWLEADALVTDPPYPNNAGWFDDAVAVAREVLAPWHRDALVFWTELEHPPVKVPLVAVHIWHRTNVNGRPYEPVYHFAVDGKKRRSQIIAHCQLHSGVGPGAAEYVGHPTQKPADVMRTLIDKLPGTVADPFAGSGSTLVAAKRLGRKAVGVEVREDYCELIARRLSQGVLDFGEVTS